jgi:hypothetical protein
MVHRPEFQIQESTAFRKLNVFASSGEGMETSTVLGPLERADKEECLRLAPSKGPNTAAVSVPLPEDGNTSSFRNVLLP